MQNTLRAISLSASIVLVVVAGVLSIHPGRASADTDEYSVYSPVVERGESQIEVHGYTKWGTGNATESESGIEAEFGYAFTGWWYTEVGVSFEKEVNASLKFDEFEWDNVFQLTPQGRYWMDIGFLNENDIPRDDDEPLEISFGPIVQKNIGRFSMLLNLLAAHQFGTNAESGVGIIYRTRLQYGWRTGFSPVVEAYGMPVGRIGEYERPRNQVGPGIIGQVPIGSARNLSYRVVFLFGAGKAAADGTLVLRLEYEF